MKKRFTEAQIVFALRQAQAGTPVAMITRKNGVTYKENFLGSFILIELTAEGLLLEIQKMRHTAI